MEKPASAGAHGPSGNVVLAIDSTGYAPSRAALQARTLSRRYKLTPAVAAAVASLVFQVPEHWRGRA